MLAWNGPCPVVGSRVHLTPPTCPEQHPTISGDKVDNGTDVATGGSWGCPSRLALLALGRGGGGGAAAVSLSAPLPTEYRLPGEVEAESFPAVGPCAPAWTSLPPFLSLKEIPSLTQDPAPTSGLPPDAGAAEALPSATAGAHGTFPPPPPSLHSRNDQRGHLSGRAGRSHEIRRFEFL